MGLIFCTYLPCRRRGATTAVGSSGWEIDERRSRGARSTRDHQARAELNSYNGSDLFGDVADGGASIGRSADHRINIIARALIWSVITAEINRRGLNLSRWIEIERGKFEALYNAYPRIRSWPSITIGRPRYFRNGP